MKKIKILVIVLFSFLVCILIVIQLFGTQIGVNLSFIERPIYLVKPSPQRFAKDALYIMEKNGIYAEENNFSEKKKSYLSQIKNATNYEDTLPTLYEAIKVAGGEHSHVITVDEKTLKKKESVNEYLISYPRKLKADDILTLILPNTVKLIEQTEQEKYIETALSSFDNNLKGVIVDLRGNRGGNVAPMLAAVSPILSDGVLYSNITTTKKIDISLKSNTLFADETKIFQFDSINKMDLPVAVLVDNQTGSAAEATMIALKGNANGRTFGQETSGYATGVALYPVYGEYALQLAGTKVEGLDGVIYEEKPIVPDVLTDSPEEEAVVWLKQQQQ